MIWQETSFFPRCQGPRRHNEAFFQILIMWVLTGYRVRHPTWLSHKFFCLVLVPQVPVLILEA